MSADLEAAFSRLRPGRFVEMQDEGLSRHLADLGNPAAQGFLADGSVLSDTIRVGAVIADKIAAGAVETDKLAANAVTAAKIAANTITANEIAANTITAAQIAANTLTANEIAANAITASELSASAVTTDKLAANAVTAAKIAANTITANEIAANTLTANEIAANAITASEIAADAVTTTKILAANVTSSRMEVTISGKNFSANDGSAGAPGYAFDTLGSTGMFYSGGAVGLASNGTVAFVSAATLNQSNVRLQPGSDNTDDLGTTSLRWATVYRVAESSVSDQREKMDIADSALGLDFVMALRPRSFRWRDTVDTQARELAEINEAALARECLPLEDRIRDIRIRQQGGEITDEDADSKVDAVRQQLSAIMDRYIRPAQEANAKRRPGRRLHYGLVAQEVKAALDAMGVDSGSAGFWQQDPMGRQSLSYSELMIPLIRAVQQLTEKVIGLERLTERG